MATQRPSVGDEADRTLALEDRPLGLSLMFVVPFGPRFDSRHGGRVIAQLLRHLTARHAVTVVYQRLPGSLAMDSELERRCAAVHEVPFPDRADPRPALRHRKRLLGSLLGGPPTAVSAIHHRRFAQVVRQVAHELSPDVIQIEHDALGYCLRGLDAVHSPRILVCHDPGLVAARDLIGAAAGPRRLARRVDAAAWRRYWARTLRHADRLVTFTAEDARAVSQVVRTTPTEVIPLGIDIPAVPDDPLGAEPPRVVFIGGYVHPPNADAALRLIREIMPAVRRQRPGLKLMLVGDQPTQEMLDAVGPDDEITGAVESVAPYIDRAALIVLPIRLGGGMRVKLLEALAAGKAVVASPVATAGLAVADGAQLRIATSEPEFARAILELLAEPDTRRRLAGTARSWAKDHLNWDICSRRYEALYRSLEQPGR